MNKGVTEENQYYEFWPEKYRAETALIIEKYLHPNSTVNSETLDLFLIVRLHV